MDGVQFARGVKALRHRRRWRQLDLAREAGLSRGAIARIEQGRADTVTVATLERIARPLGARVVCRLSWNGEGLDRLLDADHAAIVEQVVALLRGAGWVVAAEVSFNVYGERGSIDVLAFHLASSFVLVVEVKSVVPDIQAMLTAIDRKERLALGIARARGWNGIAVAAMLVVRDDRTARRRIARHASTFDAMFPMRGHDVRRWIRAPEPHWVRALWFLSGESQVATRRRLGRSRAVPERGGEPKS
jgi:transcriptional regulator with XRE-family HTH domain